jgi:hypothetical protein
LLPKPDVACPEADAEVLREDERVVLLPVTVIADIDRFRFAFFGSCGLSCILAERPV